MLTISLLRHAKSDWVDPELGDFERPLAPRGIAAAPVIDQFMHDHDVRPELVLCSTAKRAMETLNLLKHTFGNSPEIVFEDKLYMASARTMMEIATNVTKTCKHVMLVAHNPGLHILALALAEMGQSEPYLKLIGKYPTATLTVLDFDCDDWSNIVPGQGKLRHFVTPKSLMK